MITLKPLLQKKMKHQTAFLQEDNKRGILEKPTLASLNQFAFNLHENADAVFTVNKCYDTKISITHSLYKFIF